MTGKWCWYWLTTWAPSVLCWRGGFKECLANLFADRCVPRRKQAEFGVFKTSLAHGAISMHLSISFQAVTAAEGLSPGAQSLLPSFRVSRSSTPEVGKTSFYCPIHSSILLPECFFFFFLNSAFCIHITRWKDLALQRYWWWTFLYLGAELHYS